MQKIRPLYKSVFFFICRSILFYAVFFWCWSYCVPYYTSVITSVTNEELHILGLDAITRTGPSLDPKYDIAVYNRDAAAMQDSLFDFKLESLRSILPMFLALTAAMPFSWNKKLRTMIPGILLLLLIESLGCLLVVSWSYIFLPDHHIFSPFHSFPLRDSIVGFLYGFYNSVGIEFFPILIWIIFSFRRETIVDLLRSTKHHSDISIKH